MIKNKELPDGAPKKPQPKLERYFLGEGAVVEIYANGEIRLCVNPERMKESGSSLNFVEMPITPDMAQLCPVLCLPSPLTS